MPDNAGYNDRVSATPNDDALPKPQIEIIVDGESYFKPGMRTYFVDTPEGSSVSDEWETRIMGEYCVCDTVLSTKGSCECDSYCTCDSYSVCASDCSCVGYSSSSSSGTSCSCQSVSCGSPCACVPVH